MAEASSIRIAIVGTAGRTNDASRVSLEAWNAMLADARRQIATLKWRVFEGRAISLVSGGAAWADHLAVALYLEAKVEELSLFLPAPFNGLRFHEANAHPKDPGFTANHLHGRFRRLAGIDGLREIAQAQRLGARLMVGEGFKDRNAAIAANCDVLLAYTFGSAGRPAEVMRYDEGFADGVAAGLKPRSGTLDTWNKTRDCQFKIHIPIGCLLAGGAAQPRTAAHAA